MFFTPRVLPACELLVRFLWPTYYPGDKVSFEALKFLSSPQVRSSASPRYPADLMVDMEPLDPWKSWNLSRVTGLIGFFGAGGGRLSLIEIGPIDCRINMGIPNFS